MNLDIVHLRENGLTVEQKSPWHYHVVGAHTYVNVWPTKRKWMIAFGSGASYYHSAKELLHICKKILDRSDPRWLVRKINEEYERKLTPEMRAAQKQHDEDMAILYEIISLA